MTTAQARILLGLAADATRDALIAAVIPLAQSKVVEHCGAGSFLLCDAQVVGSGIAFVSGSTATITDSDSGFVTALLQAGDVNVRFSKRNDGVKSVDTVAAGVLTLSSGEVLKDEEAGSEIIITQVEWPKSLSLDFIQLIAYYLTRQGKLVSSEVLPGGYQVQYKSEDEVMHLFDKYRMAGAQ